MPTTLENLKTAFAGESQANRKYLAYAKKAEQEGYTNIAKLFRAAAEAETTHALGHLQAMGVVGNTLDNLKDAISGETFEYTEMYPPMLEQAINENHKAKTMFGFANKAEQVHAKLYQQAFNSLQSGKDLPVTDIYICPICGDIEYGNPPERCPICNVTGDRFQKVV